MRHTAGRLERPGGRRFELTAVRVRLRGVALADLAGVLEALEAAGERVALIRRRPRRGRRGLKQ